MRCSAASPERMKLSRVTSVVVCFSYYIDPSSDWRFCLGQWKHVSGFSFQHDSFAQVVASGWKGYIYM